MYLHINRSLLNRLVSNPIPLYPVFLETPHGLVSSCVAVISTKPEIGGCSGNNITIFDLDGGGKSSSASPKRLSVAFLDGMVMLIGIL